MLLRKNNFTFDIFFLADIFFIFLSWIVSYLLRFNFEIPDNYIENMEQNYLLLLFELLALLAFGFYRGLIRLFSFEDLTIIVISSILSSLFYEVFSYYFYDKYLVPRSVLIINSCLFIIFLGGYRGFLRWLSEISFFFKKKQNDNKENIVIVGINNTTITLARDIKKNANWNLLGFVDIEKNSANKRVFDINVISSLSNFSKILDKVEIKKILMSSDEISNKNLNLLLKLSRLYKFSILKTPSLQDILTGNFLPKNLKQIDIEDLLGRKEVALDHSKLSKFIENKSVFISGAGGSIGSELCVQLIKFKPKMLICVDMSELALYNLEEKLSNLNWSHCKYLILDIKNNARLENIFVNYSPDIVFHAAAYKHVPLTEHLNVSETLINNVIGTYNLAKISTKFKANKFILVSSDKAVNPTNIMGASKYLSELVCRSLQLTSTNTDFIITRFGNVLGSSGSVIPKFREQIAKGGPITITHPNITRYFMSIPEAAQLVIQASLMGKRCEIFLLEMGKPIKILKLAKDMINLSGFNESEIRISFSGLRPGEKLYEELLNHSETIIPTKHSKLKIAVSEKVSRKLAEELIDWVLNTTNKKEIQIKIELKRWVKDYSIQN